MIKVIFILLVTVLIGAQKGETDSVHYKENDPSVTQASSKVRYAFYSYKTDMYFGHSV